MAKFQIMTPDGYEVEVDAPTEAQAIEEAKKNYKTMPRIIAKQPGDIRIFERPSGDRYLVSPGYSTSDAKKIEQVLQGANIGELVKAEQYEDVLEEYPITSKLAQFVKGVPFVGSYLDEALGVISPEATTGTRALQSAMEAQRPGQTALLNIAGGLTGGAGIAAGLPRAVTGAVVGPTAMRTAPGVARGIATGTALGGAEGAIYGYGEGTTPEERMAAAQRGAGFGAAAGGVFGGALPLVSKGAKNLADVIKKSDLNIIANALNISSNAAKVIKNTFQMGGDMDAAMAAIKKAGDEGMLADAGQAAQALLDASASGGGQAGTIARTAIDQRMQRTGRSLNTTLDATLGDAAIGPRTAVEAIAARTAPERKRLYNAAYDSQINYSGPEGEAILKVLNRTPNTLLSNAIKEANEIIQMSDEPQYVHELRKQIQTTISDDGKVSFEELPNVLQLDVLKKAIQTISRENVDNFGRLTEKGIRYDKLASQLRDAVSDAVPVYGDAVKLGGDKISEERAFKLGAELLRPNTELEDVLSQFGEDASAAQISAAKQGLRRYIDKAIGDVRAIASDPTAEAIDAREVIKVVTDLSSKNARKKIKAMLGAEADALLKQIDEAAQSASVRAALAVNSKTAQRTAIRESVEQVTQPGVFGTAMRGEPLMTSQKLIQAVSGQTDEFTEAQKQRIFEEISRALTQRRGRSAQEALRLINSAMEGQPLTDAQNQFLAQQIALTLYGGVAPTTGRSAEQALQ
jgi:hypothetical protein